MKFTLPDISWYQIGECFGPVETHVQADCLITYSRRRSLLLRLFTYSTHSLDYYGLVVFGYVEKMESALQLVCQLCVASRCTSATGPSKEVNGS